MAGTELAKAYVQILPSAAGMTNNLKQVMGGPSEEAGKHAGRKLGASLIKVVAAARIGTVVKKAVSEAMDLEQNLGGTEAVFGEFASKIQNLATTAYKNMGASASEYMAYANKMGSLFQGSGLKQQESLDLTAKAMQRAADVASVMGIDTSAALESIAGAAKGNFTMMDNLGVAMNATTLEAYALEKGINFQWNTASNAEKAQLAMKMFFDRTQQYAGNFARESEETLSGSLGAVKAAWKDFLGNVAIGGNIGESVSALTQTFKAVVKNLFPIIAEIVSGLPPALLEVAASVLPTTIQAGVDMVSGILAGMSNAMPWLLTTITAMIPQIVEMLATGLPSMIEGGAELLMAIVQGITDAIPGLAQQLPVIITTITSSLSQSIGIILDAAIQLFSAIIDAIPLIIPPLLQALPSIIKTLVNFIVGNIGLFVDAAVLLLFGLIDAIPIIIDALAPELPKIIRTITTALIRAIPKIISASAKALLGIVSAVPRVLGSLLKAMSSIGLNLVKGIWQGISDAAGWVLDKIKGFGQSILNGIKSIFGIHSPSKEMAWMGEMLDRGLANGITGNLKPIQNAMDQVVRMTTGSLESKITMQANTSFSAESFRSGDSVTVITLLDTLITRLQNMKVVLDSGEAIGWVDAGLNKENGKQARGVI